MNRGILKDQMILSTMIRNHTILRITFKRIA